MQIYEALGRVHGSLETNGDVIQTHLLADLFLFFSYFFFDFQPLVYRSSCMIMIFFSQISHA